jgi:hypothetical protein
MGNTFKRNSLLELLGQLINELSKLPQQGQEHQLGVGFGPWVTFLTCGKVVARDFF